MCHTPTICTCILRTQHGAFLDTGHLHVATSFADIRFVDDLLSGKRLKLNIGVTIPHWLTMPFVQAKTDLIAVVPEKMAFTLHFSELRIEALPFEAPPFSWNLYWHKRDASNAAHLWLREQIFHVCKILYSSGMLPSAKTLSMCNSPAVFIQPDTACASSRGFSSGIR